jgi:hypothetical protein
MFFILFEKDRSIPTPSDMVLVVLLKSGGVGLQYRGPLLFEGSGVLRVLLMLTPGPPTFTPIGFSCSATLFLPFP